MLRRGDRDRPRRCRCGQGACGQGQNCPRVRAPGRVVRRLQRGDCNRPGACRRACKQRKPSPAARRRGARWRTHAATAALCGSRRAGGGGRRREGMQVPARCAGSSRRRRPRRPRRGAGRPRPAADRGRGRTPVTAARPPPDGLSGASGTAQARRRPQGDTRHRASLRAPIDAQADLNTHYLRAHRFI